MRLFAFLLENIFIFTWRNLRLEHVHSDNVDEHDPTRLLQDVVLVLHKGNRGDTLKGYLNMKRVSKLDNFTKLNNCDTHCTIIEEIY